MPKWLLVYQAMPTNYNPVHTLVIEADSREAAYATAYDCLSQRELAISSHSEQLNLNREALQALGVPLDGYGDITIKSIEPYAVKVTGRVVGAEHAQT